MKKLKEYLVKVIEAKKDILIDAFSHVYGQEHHDYIKERINDTRVWVYNDQIYRVDLESMKRCIDDHNDEYKQEGIEAVDFYIKLRRLYDDYNKYIYSELKKLYPTLTSNGFPRPFIDYFRSFDNRLGKDHFKNRSILRSRIAFFNRLGINLGDDYSAYERDPECKKLIPNKQMKKIFYELCDELNKKERALMEMFGVGTNLKEIQELLTNEGYLITDLSEEIKRIKGENVSFCKKNMKDGKLAPVIFFNLKTLTSKSEFVFVHEFAHAIAMSSMKKSCLNCGNGNYKYLNEAVEDCSIAEVYKYIVDNNNTIFLKQPSFVNDSIYRCITPIGKAFVDKFKPYMSKIRFGSEEELYQIVDKELLEKLEGICESILVSRNLGEDYKTYIELLTSAAIKEINNYNPNKKR